MLLASNDHKLSNTLFLNRSQIYLLTEEVADIEENNINRIILMY